MNKDLLEAAYNSEDFRKRGHQLIELMTDHLKNTLQEKNNKVIDWELPGEALQNWQSFLNHGSAEQLFLKVLQSTTHIHHPRYMGHQVSPSIPIGALSNLIGGLLNNGMAVYEMGTAPTAMERIVTDWLCEKIGFAKEARGFLTSGGTLANLTALITARNMKVKDSWDDGNNQPLGIMVSEEAHYCVNRAAKIMGLGEQGIIKVPVTQQWSLDTEQLENYLADAKSKGIHVFAIVGSAPTTATGIFDDLEALSHFAQKHDLWFHVDGAHGGAGVLSSAYKHTVAGIDLADSVVIDGHKMMMMPTLTTALLYKNGLDSHATFSQKADYLLEQSESEDEDWYNMAKRTFECTKTMMSLHWFSILKFYGEEIFDAFVTRLYDLGSEFAAMIDRNPFLELAVKPQSNIVCFRLVRPDMTEQALNELNLAIRKQLLEAGRFYIVQTKLKGIVYLRTTVMNPFTQTTHFQQLLKAVEHLGTKLT